MKISKELKYATFEYDEETKKFLIIDTEDGGVVELNKVSMQTTCYYKGDNVVLNLAL